jgi:hypothetical protein
VNGFANEAFAAATERAAMRLQEHALEIGGPVLKEQPYLRDTVRDALRPEFGDAVHPHEVKLPFRGWTDGKVDEKLRVKLGGTLGGVDVLVNGTETGSYRYMAELKWAKSSRELGWTLWDLFKMVAGTYRPDTAACFLLVGAPRAMWEAGDHCAALFATNIWDSARLFVDYEVDFIDLLKGGTARLLEVPSRVATTLVANIPIKTDAVDWELRCIAVGPASMDWLKFDEAWPVGHADLKAALAFAKD